MEPAVIKICPVNPGLALVDVVGPDRDEHAVETISHKAASSKKAYELLLAAQNALDQEDSESFLRAMTELLTMKNELGEAGQALCKELEAYLPQE